MDTPTPEHLWGRSRFIRIFVMPDGTLLGYPVGSPLERLFEWMAAGS